MLTWHYHLRRLTRIVMSQSCGPILPLIWLDSSHVTAHKERLTIINLPVEGVIGHKTLRLPRLQLQDHCVHAEHGSRLAALRKEFLAPDSTRHNVAHKWISFGQICCKVHFLPLVVFFESKSRKPKVRPDRVRPNKVHLPIYTSTKIKVSKRKWTTHSQAECKCSPGATSGPFSPY